MARLGWFATGHLPEREAITGIGAVPVKVSRVRDRGSETEKVRFTSTILPPCLRKAKSIEEPLPCSAPMPQDCPKALYRGARLIGGTTMIAGNDAISAPGDLSTSAPPLGSMLCMRLPDNGWRLLPTSNG